MRTAYSRVFQVNYQGASTVWQVAGTGPWLIWADQEVLKLVELWGEDSVQEKLDGCKRNSQVYV